MNNDLQTLQQEAIGLLKELITSPSFSKQEDQTAGIISRYLAEKRLYTSRLGNNVISFNQHFDAAKPTLLLNSHHDTVKPNSAYSKDPFKAIIDEGKLYGLGSNDAGGALVSLIAAYVYFYHQPGLKYNLALAATAEEEVSGSGGIEMVLNSPYFNEPLKGKPIDCAIVGEPTLLQLAVAERGLMVLDNVSIGKAGHAARNEGENAIYKAFKDIEWYKNHRFEKISDLLGPVQMSITVIETENKAHNVVPDKCHFIADIRVNEKYSLEEVLDVVRKNVQSEITPRSLRMRSTSISLDHPLVKAGISLGKSGYGSPTTSDKALMPFPVLKVGPGDSARSHTADEFIYIQEINDGIEFYIDLLKKLL
ncbi:MAG: M20 family metallo-hydrolase [Chitinophagaceae bacterium]|jgi:acetylornithine deacetylase|nr:M20 family metallo-hydrolase [Chitinophagaceae bacterium]